MTMECEMFMDAFSDMTKPALAASGEASCDLWTADSLAMAAAKIKGTACDISTLNMDFTAAKKNCTSAFGACRKLEDKVINSIEPRHFLLLLTLLMKHKEEVLLPWP